MTEQHLTRAHLEHCRGGDKITIPDGWTAPAGSVDKLAPAAQSIGPGWTLEHDGGNDSIPWSLCADTGGLRSYLSADKVETLCIPVSALERADGGDVEDVPVVDDDDTEDEDTEDEDCIGTKYVKILPDTSGFAEALQDALGGESAAIGVSTDPRLDEFQHERVASLENALRILESRRAPTGGSDGALGNLFRKPADVPMVGKRDLIDVAAFIASEDTGRTEAGE